MTDLEAALYEADRADARAEAQAERAHGRRRRHWCQECRGHTGPGSPCHEPADDDEFILPPRGEDCLP